MYSKDVQTSRYTTLTRLRLGGTAAILAGLCYGAAGYLDRLGISGFTSALVSVLSVAIPALFLGGLLGLHSRLLLTSRRSPTSGAGLLSGCLGAMLGIVGAVGLEQTPYLELTRITDWWWGPLLAGLTLMGLTAFLKEGLRSLGALVLMSGALGWVSLLTDPAFSGVLLPIRPVHVAFAAMFCLSSVAWGSMLLVGPHSLKRPKP
jgi:hypothetical protein